MSSAELDPCASICQYAVAVAEIERLRRADEAAVSVWKEFGLRWQSVVAVRTFLDETDLTTMPGEVVGLRVLDLLSPFAPVKAGVPTHSLNCGVTRCAACDREDPV